jgi:hypothetical protein
MSDEIKYMWLAVVAFVGGLIGYCRKQAEKDAEKSPTGKLGSLSLSIVTSMFIAYIVYEISVTFIEHNNVCVALAGLASFAGTDALVAGEKMLLKKLGKWGG